MIAITINGVSKKLLDDPSTPLLWVLGDTVKLKGTKYGCGAGLCGACTVHINGKAALSCQTLIADIDGSDVVTIEGLSRNGGLNKVQQAWIAEDVPQCGYCQAGQIMQAVDLLKNTPTPTDQQIIRAMSGNLCRCGTYSRIHKAIRLAAGMTEGNNE